jgi:hypothetical protein
MESSRQRRLTRQCAHSRYIFLFYTALSNFVGCRENLREQNALSDEIAEAMNHVNIANRIDEADLDAELEELQQEQLDEQLLKTNTASISGTIHGMPAAPNKERKTSPLHQSIRYLFANAPTYQLLARLLWRKRRTWRQNLDSYRRRWLCKVCWIPRIL